MNRGSQRGSLLIEAMAALALIGLALGGALALIATDSAALVGVGERLVHTRRARHILIGQGVDPTRWPPESGPSGGELRWRTSRSPSPFPGVTVVAVDLEWGRQALRLQRWVEEE